MVESGQRKRGIGDLCDWEPGGNLEVLITTGQQEPTMSLTLRKSVGRWELVPSFHPIPLIFLSCWSF